MKTPVKVLVLQFASIGDVVLATPIIRCLKEQLDHAEVHFCTRPAFASLVEHNPYLTKYHVGNESPLTLIRELRAERFAMVVDLQNNLLTNFVKAALGVRSYSVETHRLRHLVYLRSKINTLPPGHVVDRYFAAIESLGVEDDEMGADYFIPYKDHVEADWLPPTHQSSYVAYAIGGRHFTSRLPVSKMIELCEQLDFPVVLLGNKADRAAGEAVVKAVGSKRVFNGCGLFNLNQSASIIENARAVFAHDTGLMQIAAAFGKRVYSIWGGSTPNYGWYPYATSYVRIEKLGLPCRPCTVSGSGKCPKKHFSCMNDISFEFAIRDLHAKKHNLE